MSGKPFPAESAMSPKLTAQERLALRVIVTLLVLGVIGVWLAN